MTMVGAGAPWQVEFEKVEQRCGYLLTSGHRSDCTFVVGSEPKTAVVAAHKLILAMASPVFDAMFYGGQSEHYEPMIPVSDVQPEAFRALLQYIYTGRTNITSFEMASDLWLLAKKYTLPYLEIICKSYVCSVVCPRNACQVYEFASLIEEKSLMNICIQIISSNTKEVLKDKSFVDATFDTVLTVLSLDHLNVDSELDLFHAVARYNEAQTTQGRSSPPVNNGDGRPPSEELSESVESPKDKALVLNDESSSQNSPAVDIDSKKPSEEVFTSEQADNENFNKEVLTIRAAIKKIRFLALTPQQFADGPARSRLLTKEESFAVLMNIVSRISAVPMPTGFSECRQQRNEVNQETNAQPLLKPGTESRIIPATNWLTIEEIIEGLESSDRDTLKAAARAARFISSDDDSSDKVAELVEAGVIPLLVAALDQPWSGVKYDVTVVLANILTDVDAIVDDDAVPELVALLNSGGVRLAEQAALVLGYIAQTNSIEIVHCGAVPALISLMQPSTPLSQLETYLWCYRMVCESKVEFEKESRVFLYIKNLLGVNDEPVLGCTRHKVIQEVGMDQCLGAGFMDHIINFLKCGNPSHVVSAARVVAEILNGTTLHIQQALDKGVLDALEIILTEGYYRYKLQAVLALSNLCCKGSASQLRDLAFGAALEPFCRLLANDHYSYDVLRGLTYLLLKIEQNVRDALCLKLLEFDVPKLLIPIQEHEDELASERAAHILKTYFSDDVNEKGRL